MLTSLLWIGEFRQSVSTPSIIWLDLFFSLTNSSSGSRFGLEEEEEEHGNTQTTAAAKDPVTTLLMRQKQLKYISSSDCNLWQATRLMTHTRIQILNSDLENIKKAFNIIVEELLIQAKLEIMNAACLFPERYLCSRPPARPHITTLPGQQPIFLFNSAQKALSAPRSSR